VNGGLAEEDSVRPERCTREWTRCHHVVVIGKEEEKEEEERGDPERRMEKR
jgi:hypothetical protein